MARGARNPACPDALTTSIGRTEEPSPPSSSAAARSRCLKSRCLPLRFHGTFWAAHAGGELDLLLTRGTKQIGVEIKRTSMPKVTRFMHAVLEILDLAELIVIHAGRDSFRLAGNIRAVSANRLGSDLGLGRWPRL